LGRGLYPIPSWELTALSRLPSWMLGLRGPTSKGRKGEGKGGRDEKEGEGKTL